MQVGTGLNYKTPPLSLFKNQYHYDEILHSHTMV